MAVKVEQAHQTVSQDKIPHIEIRTAEGFIDPQAALLLLENALKSGTFPLGHPETGLMGERKDPAGIPFEQRILEEWGGKFQNGLLIPTNDLKEHQGIIGNTIQEIAINVAAGLAQEGFLEKVVNLGTLLTLRTDPDFDSARRAFALAETIARAAEKREIEDRTPVGKYYPSMAVVEDIKAKYEPFFNFVSDRRLDTLPSGVKKFYQADIDKANAEEKAAVEENGAFLAQRVKLPAR